MPTLKVRVPQKMTRKGLSAPRLAKNALVKALASNKRAETMEIPQAFEWTDIYLSDKQVQEIEKAAARDGLTMNRWIEVILYQSSNGNGKQAEVRDDLAWMRPEQRILFEAARKAADGREFLFAQAGTGVGKTRAILASAADALHRGIVERAVIAFPSLQTIGHAASEIGRLPENMKASVAILLGSTQFASVRRLNEWLKNDQDMPDNERHALEEWIAKGAPALTDHARAVSALSPVSHLMVDVAFLAPSLPRSTLDAIALSADEAGEKDCEVDAGAAAYRLPRKAAENAKLVLCTHAMLGCHMRNTDLALIPEFQALYVDEAHLLEANIANALTRVASLYMVRKRLLAMAAPSSRKKAAAYVDRMEQFCHDWLLEEDTTSLMAFAMPDDMRVDEFKRMAADLNRICRNALRRCKRDEGNDIRLMRRDAEVFGAMAHARTPVFVTSTPMEKKWRVSVGTGPANIRTRLKELFDSLKTGGLYSASLAIPDKKGRWNPSYMQTVLGVPAYRTHLIPPIEHEWGYTTPEVYCAMASALVRPAEEMMGESAGKDAFDDWMDAVADVVARLVLPSAAGGTLVLMTGYRWVQALASRLEGAGFKDRLLVQKRGDSVASLKERFVEMYRQDLFPVWVATGPAWTGLDLRDTSIPDDMAEADLLLTDLVIPAVQTNTSRTTTYVVRSRSKLRMNVLAAETFFATMQGMGRLVRRPGLKHRRMWILDPRIWDDERKRWLLPLRRYVEKFPNRRWI